MIGSKSVRIYEYYVKKPLAITFSWVTGQELEINKETLEEWSWLIDGSKTHLIRLV